MNKLAVLFSALLLQFTPLRAQFAVNIQSMVAVDYVMPPEKPQYRQFGYENQFQLRYGLGVLMKIHDRFGVGVNLDRYRRTEAFDCMYFPKPDDPPQAAWNPIIENDAYECEYSYLSKIDFIEIPIIIRYDLIAGRTFRAFIGGGYGYQFVTKRSTLLTDRQTGMESQEVTKDNFLRSRESVRLFSGITKKVSERFSLDIGLEYRTDSFAFAYQSLGLTTRVAYGINK